MQKLYYGGDIITMVREDDAPEAVLVEDGKIRFVGDLEQAKALCGAEAAYIDLQGKTLMPSFIDGHSHISMYSQFAAYPDISGCTSFAEIQDYLRDYVKEHELTEDDVLLAVGYDHNFLKEEAHPTRDVLDAVSDRIPIYLSTSTTLPAIWAWQIRRFFRSQVWMTAQRTRKAGAMAGMRMGG